MRKVLLIGLLTVAPLVTGVAVSLATVTQSVDFTVKVIKKDRHKSHGGLTLRTTFKVADDTGAKPPPLTNTTLRFPKGAALNARYFKKCSVSTLSSKGPSACPKESVVGKGTATGDARPILADVKAKITLFNGQSASGNPAIIVYAQPEISAPFAVQGEIKRQKGGPYGYVLSVDVPPIPTLPGQPNASVVFFDATTLDRTVKRKGRLIHYIEGPILCDGTYFLIDGTFSYEGGITNTVYERFTLNGGPRC
jgi:hypothetical protein